MSHSIHRLHMASVKLSGQFNPPTFLDTRVNVYGYLVITESDVLLIDTGIGEGVGFIDRVFEPRRSVIAEELARYDLQTQDVTMIVNSHLHFDHCGNNKLFPDAEVFVQAAELAIAQSPKYTVKQWFEYEGARVNPVTEAMEISSGIQLLQSPGHTPGHQSVLVETSAGKVLIAAQAAYTAEEYKRGGDPEIQAHEGFEEQYKRSIAGLKSLAPTEVYFSHDDRVVTSADIKRE